MQRTYDRNFAHFLSTSSKPVFLFWKAITQGFKTA